MQDEEIERLLSRTQKIQETDNVIGDTIWDWATDVFALWKAVGYLAREVRPGLFPPDPPPPPFDIEKAGREMTELRSEIARLKEALNG